LGYSSDGHIGELNDLWKYDGANWTWVSGSNTIKQSGTYGTKGTADPSNVPGARDAAVSWLDSQGNLWLFGGMGYGSDNLIGYLNDLWKFDPTTLEWTWVSGTNVGWDTRPIYGTRGTADPSNIPGGRHSSVTFIDSSGNLWLFGGFGWGTDTQGYLNDLWKFDPTILEWTWVSGSNTVNQSGTYGTKGIPAPSNVPGGKESPVSWLDPQGNFWVFGGTVNGSPIVPRINDLWKYYPGSNEWTWVSGSNLNDQAGVYGTKGIAAPLNVPGARFVAVSCLDSAGKLRLFGGWGFDSVGAHGDLNDLWKFDPTTLEWTWVSGSNSADQAGTYGTKGISDPTNVPGARQHAVSWNDPSGNLWVFGGIGFSDRVAH
jgi:N-acetylneuraminic acid mutarotase